jgi:hypothetical protein
MAYGDNSGTPGIAQTVTYFLTLEEYNRYGVQSVQATIYFIHTPTCVDLQATFTTKGQKPGQSVTLNELNATYGQNQGNWCEAGGYQGVIPRGSPW